MIRLKVHFAAGILVMAIAASAGVTYIATAFTKGLSISCPPVATTAQLKPDLPRGTPIPLNQCKSY